ncbi:MAG: terminase small subunit [Nostoc sp. NMS7]|uniref:terminase small subunit n=1 Tax=Nostoc sp. NMS7 TaxID=2815391 RepID=UPI00260011B4|nr:terminase small subunit [Nostoc sp. NMS7]MBN3949382.1 terminase small subunit [Nostoc sp. NMS7]
MAKRAENPHGLTDLQLRFCQEYVKDLNGTKAYLRAGYTAKSESAAAAGASALITNPKIKIYLGELLSLTEASVISEIAKIAFANFTDIADFTSNSISVKSSDTLSDRGKSALQSIKFTERYTEEGKICTVEVKMHDKLAALEKLMRRLRLYPQAMSTMSAVTHLLSQGLLTDDQARVIIDGVSGIEEGLRSLTSRKPESTDTE